MAENIAHHSTGFVKPLQKVNDVQKKRAPLGVIYDNMKCADIQENLRPKYQKQPDFKYSLCSFPRNFEVYADENEDKAAVEKEDDTMQKYLDEINDKIFQKPCETPPEKVLYTETDEKLLKCYAPFREEIYSYFRKVERKFRVKANYMEKQPDITLNMRSVLIDWLVEVAQEYKLSTETLYLTVSYVDRFLSRMSVLKEKLQLVGTASMFIASKFEEIYPPELKEFVYITDDTYTKKQIISMEHLLLKALDFDMSIPTAHAFLQIYCSMCKASENVLYLSLYICELSLLDSNIFLKFLPSITAAGSLALANYTLGLNMWDEDLVESSGYHLKELVDVVICLHNKYASMSTCPQQAICGKYKAQKYKSVSTIPVPKELVFPA